MSVPRVSIIIVNWNGYAHLDECLTSIRQQSYQNFEAILVDNGSHDGSCEFVAERHAWVKLVALPANTGFAGGNNAGLAAARGSLVITLNNDTRVDEHWLSELVRCADADDRIGMVASCICQYQQPELIDSLGVKICRDGMSRGAYRLRKLSDLAARDGEEILLPSGCAALYRREMIDQVGFFDDDFFAYCEDTDLGLRGRLAGWRAVLALKAVVYHKYSMTGGAFSPFKLYLVERNHFWLALKCLPLSRIMILPLASCQRYLLQARLVLSGKGVGADFSGSASRSACLAALLRGILHGLTALPAIVSKRRRIMAVRKITWSEYIKLLDTFSMSFNELLDVDAG